MFIGNLARGWKFYKKPVAKVFIWLLHFPANFSVSRAFFRRARKGETIERAELVAGRTVFFLLGDGREIGDVVGGRHGDAAGPESLKGWVTVEERSMLGIDIYEVKGPGVPLE